MDDQVTVLTHVAAKLTFSMSVVPSGNSACSNICLAASYPTFLMASLTTFWPSGPKFSSTSYMICKTVIAMYVPQISNVDGSKSGLPITSFLNLSTAFLYGNSNLVSFQFFSFLSPLERIPSVIKPYTSHSFATDIVQMCKLPSYGTSHKLTFQPDFDERSLPQ